MSTLYKQNKRVALFGKSTVYKNHPAYRAVETTTATLIKSGYTILHGGYAGGLMEAVDSGAASIVVLEKKKGSTIAVPLKQFDEMNITRTTQAHFLKPAEDIYDRLRTLTSNIDIAIVAPLGGEGTWLEAMNVYHNNVNAPHLGAPIIPLIFMEMPNGTQWHSLLTTLSQTLDTTIDIENLDWIYFVHSLEDLESAVQSIHETIE